MKKHDLESGSGTSSAPRLLGSSHPSPAPSAARLRPTSRVAQDQARLAPPSSPLRPPNLPPPLPTPSSTRLRSPRPRCSTGLPPPEVPSYPLPLLPDMSKKVGKLPPPAAAHEEAREELFASCSFADLGLHSTLCAHLQGCSQSSFTLLFLIVVVIWRSVLNHKLSSHQIEFLLVTSLASVFNVLLSELIEFGAQMSCS